MKYWDSNVISGLIGFVGSIIGGLFTMWGVNKTLKVQNKDKFRDEFPTKILNLDSIIEEIKNIKESKLSEYKYIVEVMYKTKIIDEPEGADSLFNKLITMSIKVDGDVYKKISRLKESYFAKYKESVQIRRKGIILNRAAIDNLGRPPATFKDSAKENIDNIVKELQSELEDLIGFLKQHKENLEKMYFSS